MGLRWIMKAMPERGKFIAAARKQITGLELVFDAGDRCAMNTFCAALVAQGDDAAVHLEDDVILCADFVAKLTAVVDALPEHPIQFFSRQKADLTVGSRWRPGGSWLMNQCFYLPPGMGLAIAAFRAEHVERHPEDAASGTDTMMAAYFKKNGIRYWNHVPSLVQHAETVSLIDRRRSSKRQSQTFQG